MQAERTKWTDERIDDLATKVESLRGEMKKGFAKVDERFLRLESTMAKGFEKIDSRFEKIDARFDKIDARFDKIDGRMWYMTATLVIAIVASRFAG